METKMETTIVLWCVGLRVQGAGCRTGKLAPSA